MPMNKKILYGRFLAVSLVYVYVFSAFVSDNSVWGCTTAVISGRATKDGRPILWKNRDNVSALPNNVILLTDGKFKAVAVSDAGKSGTVWMGMNETGFCIENSLSSDLSVHDNENGPGNSTLMRMALENCATVGDFRSLLERTNATGRSAAANIGVIDAHGGAAMFEIGPKTFQMFDANDPTVAPKGYLVRSNFSTTAQSLSASPTDEQVAAVPSGERFLRTCTLLNDVSSQQVDVAYVLRNIARDLADGDGIPYPGSVNREDGPLPTVVQTSASISRTTTVSAAVFHGVRDGEAPNLATMWAILGDPKFSIAVPCWVACGDVAPPLADKRGGELGEIALTLRDSHLGTVRDSVLTDGLPGIWSDLWDLEDQFFMDVSAARERWSQVGCSSEELTAMHTDMAERAMIAMQKELVEAKEAALKRYQSSTTLASNPIRVAIYDHSDGSANGPKTLLRILDSEHGFAAQRISPEEIREGRLDDFDVVILPGGSGSKQASMLAETGREQLRSFVDNGGGYVGICAGSYLASSHYSWSLNLINTRVWDRAHWARGTGKVKLGLSATGSDVFDSEQTSLDVYYGQGPLLIPGNNPELPMYQVLAVYESEVASNGAPTDAMIGTHAIVRSQFGNGRVLCYSPHPEAKGGPNWMILKGVRWAAKQD